MRRLAKWTTITLLVITTLLGSAVLYGRAMAGPSELQDFQLCENHPCFMDIAPGITAWDEAAALIRQYDGDEKRKFFYWGKNTPVSIMPTMGTNLVGFIQVDDPLSHFLPSVGVFFLQYGSPCRVMDNGRGGGIILLYPTMLVSLGQQIRQLSPYQPIKYIQIRSLIASDNEPLNLCGSKIGANFVKWLGFTSIDNYKSHGLIANY
jgi:hypothetical protein